MWAIASDVVKYVISEQLWLRASGKIKPTISTTNTVPASIVCTWQNSFVRCMPTILQTCIKCCSNVLKSTIFQQLRVLILHLSHKQLSVCSLLSERCLMLLKNVHYSTNNHYRSCTFTYRPTFNKCYFHVFWHVWGYGVVHAVILCTIFLERFTVPISL